MRPIRIGAKTKPIMQPPGRMRGFISFNSSAAVEGGGAELPDADQVAVWGADGPMAGMFQAPALILAAPDAAVKRTAMPIRAAAAQRERRCNGRQGR